MRESGGPTTMVAFVISVVLLAIAATAIGIGIVRIRRLRKRSRRWSRSHVINLIDPGMLELPDDLGR